MLEGDEGEHIAQALGNKKALILHNHGLLTTANTVEATVFWYVSLEKLCHIYLTALAAVGGDASKVVPVKKEDAEEYVSGLTISSTELTSVIGPTSRLVCRCRDGSRPSHCSMRLRSRLTRRT